MSVVQRYQQRISGRLMDRIDIHVEVPCVPFQKLTDLAGSESSAMIRQRVEAARQVQEMRFCPLNISILLVNGDTGPAEVQHLCLLDEAGCNSCALLCST